jgi:hypothetical protein
VFLFLETVLGNEKSTFSGELSGGSHGHRRTGMPLVAGATVIWSWKLVNRRIQDQGPGLEDTLSLREFVKSPWKDWLITPRSLAPWNRLRFLVLKAYLRLVKAKYVFG